MHDSTMPSPGHWRTFTIPKRNGKFRTISAPDKELKAYLSDLAKVLEPQRRGGYGFTRGNGNVAAGLDVRNYLEDARARGVYQDLAVFAVDLADAFGSVKRAQVRKALYEAGFTRRAVRYNVAKATRRGSLPQGSPASPILLDLALKEFDEEMRRHADALGGFYARYADDIVFLAPVEPYVAEGLTRRALAEWAPFASIAEEKTQRGLLRTRKKGFELFGIRVRKHSQQARRSTRNAARATLMLERNGWITDAYRKALAKDPNLKTDPVFYAFAVINGYVRYIQATNRRVLSNGSTSRKSSILLKLMALCATARKLCDAAKSNRKRQAGEG